MASIIHKVFIHLSAPTPKLHVPRSTTAYYIKQRYKVTAPNHLPNMSRSSSSSTSSSSGASTPSPQDSPVLWSSFDPFAVHPFTRYSGPSKASHSSQSPAYSNAPAPGPYGSQTHYSSHPYHHHTPNGILHPSAIPAAPGYESQASQTQSEGGAYKPIFTPFRQDTSSPDLSDVLRRKQMGF